MRLGVEVDALLGSPSHAALRPMLMTVTGVIDDYESAEGLEVGKAGLIYSIRDRAKARATRNSLTLDMLTRPSS